MEGVLFKIINFFLKENKREEKGVGWGVEYKNDEENGQCVMELRAKEVLSTKSLTFTCPSMNPKPRKLCTKSLTKLSQRI